MAVAKILQNVQFSDNWCPTVICWLLKGDLLHGDVCSVEAVSTINEFCDHSYISEMKKRINFSHVKPFFSSSSLLSFSFKSYWPAKRVGHTNRHTNKQNHIPLQMYQYYNIWCTNLIISCQLNLPLITGTMWLQWFQITSRN